MEPNLYIDGEWVPPTGGDSRGIFDPATEEEVGRAAVAAEADLDRALRAAARGFDTWRRTGTWERAGRIRAVADLVRARADEIASVMTGETGKPLAEARGEANAAADQFEWHSEEAKRVYGQLIGPRTADSRMAVIHKPVGVVAAFSAWNFPALLPARKLAAALAAGCSVIAKPAGEAPGSCAALVQACHDAGIPPGVVNFVTGDSDMIARRLLAAPEVRKVSVTGSVPVGKRILRLAAEGVKKVTMELGGHAPVIVFGDADARQAAAACAASKFRNCGQVCISPTRFYVHESRYAEFAEAFAAEARSVRVGNGRDEGTQMGPMASERGVETVRALVDDAVDAGAKVLAGGNRPAGLGRGHFFEPTVLGNVPDSARVMREEPFGPVAPLTAFQDYGEAIKRANSLPFGLAGYVFTNDLATAVRASEDLETGMVGVNEMLLAAAEAPFGGVKESGMGREGGSLGIRDYLEPKYVKMRLREPGAQ